MRFIERLILLVAMVSLVCTIVQWSLHSESILLDHPVEEEQYDPSLGEINTIEKLHGYILARMNAQNITKKDSTQFVALVDKTMRGMFLHTYSYYGWGDDYVAYLLGKTIWSDIGAVVLPEDLIKYNYGACSQQSILFMHYLQKEGYKVRPVYMGSDKLGGHFASSVFYENAWRFHDVNKEPVFEEGKPAPAVTELAKSPELIWSAYKKIPKIKKNEIIQYVQSSRLANIYEEPGKKMMFLHRATHFYSNYGWAVLFLIWISVLYYNRRKKMIAAAVHVRV